MKATYGIRKSNGLHFHWTNKNGKLQPKAQFKTLEDCLDFMKTHRINKNIYTPYVCPDCGMWHIGHSHKRNKKKYD